jgi:hypothetical protein
MMEHKAFAFDYRGFERELLPLLSRALIENRTDELEKFIDQHRPQLKVPDEGDPLSEDWRDLLESDSPHEYGDFALTKFYEPEEDLGLGLRWEIVQKAVAAAGLTVSPILGRTVGLANNPFDPGRMGSYFQSAEQVRESRMRLTQLQSAADLGTKEAVSAAIDMLAEVEAPGRGLYVTF